MGYLNTFRQLTQVTLPAPPIANAGSDITVVDADQNSRELVQLDGQGSTSEAQITGYLWTLPDGFNTEPNPIVSLPIGTHQIQLTVTDAYGQTGSDTLTVRVVSSQSNISSLDHPYFEVSGLAYQSESELPSIAGKRMFIDESKLDLYRQMRVASKYSTQRGWLESTNQKNFTGKALRYVLGDGASFGQEAIVDIYNDLMAQLNPAGDYGRVKNFHELVFSGCFVLSVCKDLFPVGQISYDDLRLAIERNLYEHSNDHRFPSSVHFNDLGGWAGHQNTMMWLHYLYCFACYDSHPQYWNELMQTHFKTNGLQDSVDIMAEWQFHNQGNSYAGAKTRALVTIEFMCRQAGFDKYLFHPKIARIADAWYYTLQSNRQLLIDGERNNNREYTQYDGLSGIFAACGMLIDEPGYNHLDLTNYFKFDSAFVDIAFQGMALLFEQKRHAVTSLDHLPYAKAYGSPGNVYGMAARTKHDMSGALNIDDFQVFFKTCLLENTSHAENCPGNVQIAFNGKLTGKTGQMTNNQFSTHAKLWVKNAAGNNMQIFARSSGDEIERIGGAKRVTGQAYTHVGLAQLATNRYAAIGWNGQLWDYLYNEIDMVPAYDGRAVTSQRAHFAGRFESLKNGTHPGFVVTYDRMFANNDIDQAVLWQLYTAGTKSGNRVVGSASRGSGHLAYYFRTTSSNSIRVNQTRSFTYRGVNMDRDADSNEMGGFHAEVEFPNAGEIRLLTLELPGKTSSFPNDSEVIFLSTDKMEGLQFFDQIVMFSKAGNLIDSDTFTFLGSGTYQVTMMNMAPGNYDQGTVTEEGGNILRFTTNPGTIIIEDSGGSNANNYYRENVPFELIKLYDFEGLHGQTFSNEYYLDDTELHHQHHPDIQPTVLNQDDDPDVAGAINGLAVRLHAERVPDGSPILDGLNPSNSNDQQTITEIRRRYARAELEWFIPRGSHSDQFGLLKDNRHRYFKIGVDYVYVFGNKPASNYEKEIRNNVPGANSNSSTGIGQDVWNSIIDLKQDGNGQSRDASFRIRMQGDYANFVMNGNPRLDANQADADTLLWREGVHLPEWHDGNWHLWTVRALWHPTNGHIYVWFDDRLVFSRVGVCTCFNDSNVGQGPYTKGGAYDADFLSDADTGSNVKDVMFDFMGIGLYDPEGNGIPKYKNSAA